MEVVISADEFMSVRNGNQNTYKKLCQSFLKVKDFTTQLKVALCILKSPPDERQDFELAVLEQATKGLDFFKNLHDQKLHYKCCKMMTYKHYNKNEIVFKEGDPSNDFFLIIDGSVNVYVRKKAEKLHYELEQEQNQIKNLTEFELESHPSTIVRYYQPPRQLQRRMTINLNEDDFEQIAKSYQPKPYILTDRQDVKHKDVDVIRKLTHGLEKIPDKDFLFNGGVFLHDLVAQIHEGQMFGERGLMIESARTGTVITTTPLHVAVLTRKDYKTILEDSQLEKIRKKTKILSQTILKNLTYKEAIESQYKFEKVHFPIGHYIYKIGETPQQLIVIKKGTVRLFLKQENKTFPICELGQDQYFGELEYFEQCDRIHTAQVTSQQFSAYQISYYDLTKLLTVYPQCERQLKRNFEQRNKINDDRLNQTLKAHQKLQSTQLKKQNNFFHSKQQSQPALQVIVSNDNSEHQNQYSIMKAKRQLSQMEFIKTKGQQLKKIRRVQKKEEKVACLEKEKSLADTLNHLEAQSQLIRREFRRSEQRRFSSITFDRESNGNNNSQIQNIQNSKTTTGNKISNFDRQISLSHQFKYQNITEQMLFNTKLQQYEILEEHQKDILTPSSQGVLISSKHNLFRSKPQNLRLMCKYQRRQPKTYSTELSIKTFFN